WLAGWIWHARGKRLYKWSRRVWNITWLSPLGGRNVDIHGGRLRDNLRYQTSVGRLICETLVRFWPGCFSVSA
ncbi:MAG: hypothetical protein QOF74_1892, partial [Caballeronia mineralivorans]|nr:hypothetical protein [Caballeronia mineralivorans]